mgnify:CR=1 FL=1
MKVKITTLYVWKIWIRFLWEIYNYSLFSTDALANFVPARLGSVLSLLCWALLIYTYFRMFSRQTYKRACENQAYLAKTAKVRHFFASQKSIMAQRKTHHIYKCPTCKQKIRVPKGKGRIEIRCPKCNTTFIKKS